VCCSAIRGPLCRGRQLVGPDIRSRRASANQARFSRLTGLGGRSGRARQPSTKSPGMRASLRSRSWRRWSGRRRADHPPALFNRCRGALLHLCGDVGVPLLNHFRRDFSKREVKPAGKVRLNLRAVVLPRSFGEVLTGGEIARRARPATSCCGVLPSSVPLWDQSRHRTARLAREPSLGQRRGRAR